MLSSASTSGDDNHRHHHNIAAAGSSSSISSSDHHHTSSSLTFYPQTTNTPKSKTMEEVWKDINLSSLQDHCHTPGGDHDLIHHHHHHHHHQNPNFIFQDFFSRPFDQDPPPPTPARGGGCGARASPLPPHVTVLTLNSSPGGFDLLQNDTVKDNHHHQQQQRHHFEGMDSSAAAAGLLPLPSFQKKRVQESDDSKGDRRHKRMIKNRESAARSRAYTNELELEVQHLMTENAKLKKQQEELRLAAAAAQVGKKTALFRTSTF
ncbi:Protein FD [Linum grandiflorum]